MKEIIKYLRQLNSFTQEEAAEKLGITRQSYIKYENGAVVPSEKMVEKMAALYDVSVEFIHENKVPDIGKRNVYYNIPRDMTIIVSDHEPVYSRYPKNEPYDVKQKLSECEFLLKTLSEKIAEIKKNLSNI